MTLLLGPPGCGKTTLLKALTGNLDKSLKVILLFPPNFNEQEMFEDKVQHKREYVASCCH